MEVSSLLRLVEHHKTSTIATLLVVSMLPTYLLWLVQAVVCRGLRTTAAPMGTVSLELAGTRSRTQAVIDSWDECARRSAWSGLWLDYPFLVSYGATLLLGCIWASRQFAAGSSWLEWVGGLFAGFAILAAAFDAVEDLALLVQLGRRPGSVWAAVAFGCASAKFLLAALASVYALAGLVVWVTSDPLERIQIVLAVVAAGGLIRAYLRSLPALVHFAFRHALLLTVFVLVYAIVYGQIGGGYGIASLFWNDQIATRISASLGVTLLLADLGIIVYFAAPELVAALVGPAPANDRPQTVASHLSYLNRFLRKGGLPWVLLLLAPAVLPAAFPSVPRPESALVSGLPAYLQGLFIWAAGIILGAIIPLLILFLLRLLCASWRPGGKEILHDVRVSILIFYAIFIGVYVLLAGPLYGWTSPAFAICALLGALMMTYALLQYFSASLLKSLHSWPVPPGALAVGLLGVAFGLANNDPYKLRFPHMTDYYPGGARGPIDLRRTVMEQYRRSEKKPLPAGGASLIDNSEALRNWLSAIKTDNPAPGTTANPKLVILAFSGGAARSAFWSAVVLDRLEAEIPGFGKHVRIITGASGGMVAAAYYINDRQGLLASQPAESGSLASVIPLNSITPVAAHVALRDVWQAFLPRIGDTDRGVVLERDWPGIDFAIQDLRKDEAKGLVPSIILSPMIIEDGRRLLISNLDLWNLASASGSEITLRDAGSPSHLYSLSALEFFRLFPYATDFHLATGVRMSASFPYVSPAVNLPTDPPRRVVDAGYYDNYGIQVAAAWVQANVEWLISHTSGVVLIQVRDAISQEERLDVADAPRGFWATLARSFQFLTSPVEGSQRARTASGLFRNDEDVQTLSRLCTARIERQARDTIKDQAQLRQALAASGSFFTTVVFENSAEVTSDPVGSGMNPTPAGRAAHHSSAVALDWYLSRAEQNALRAAILSPPANTQEQDRLDRIRGLKVQVERSRDPARSYLESQLHTSLNYENLVQLRRWWAQPGPIP